MPGEGNNNGRLRRESFAPMLFEDPEMNNDKQRPAQELKRMTHRELLKLTPVLAVGALTLPPFRSKAGKGHIDLQAARCHHDQRDGV
jgi:hypothetical protein